MTKFKNENLDYILPHLRLAGANKIEINFDGSGNSGEITEVLCNEVDLAELCPGKQETYEEILMDIAYNYLEDKEDWYNNDGGYGQIIVHLDRRVIHCDMHVRITQTEDSEYDNKI